MTASLTVADVMHKPAVVVPTSITLAEASVILDGANVGAAAVLDPQGRLRGMLSERDLLRSVGHGIDPGTAKVEEVMTKNPVTVSVTDTVEKGLEVFRERRFRHLPVMDGDRVAGILSIRHVVRVAHIEEVQPAGSAPPGLAPRGLEGVAVAETSVGDVRGEEGFFHYRGYNATELARRCSFEQVWHLLAEGELPDDAQLKAFTKLAVEARSVPEKVADLLPQIAALPGYTPLMALRSAVSLAGRCPRAEADARHPCGGGPQGMPEDGRGRPGAADAAAPPPSRPRAGRAGPRPRLRRRLHPDAHRRAPHERAIRALEQYLILTMDHGFNSSTFTARVITSTGSDIGSALTGAIGALAGPLHGGAPSRALAMLDAIGTPDKAEEYLRHEISSGERLMGFGHRVYKTDDPRSTLLREVAIELGGPQAEFAVQVEQTALRVLNELKPGRRLYTNVEFYAGVVMNSVGIPPDMFTPTFASSRTVGWTAAIAEQAANNRLIRPSALYVGPQPPRPLPDGYGAAIKSAELAR